MVPPPGGFSVGGKLLTCRQPSSERHLLSAAQVGNLPAPAVDVRKTERLIADLDSAQFEVRRDAAAEHLGTQTAAHLRRRRLTREAEAALQRIR